MNPNAPASRRPSGPISFALLAFAILLTIGLAAQAASSAPGGTLVDRLSRAALGAVPTALAGAGLVAALASASTRRSAEAEAKLEALARIEKLGYLEIDRQGRIVAANPNAAQWLEKAEIPWRSRTLADLYPLPGDTAQSWLGEEFLTPRPGAFQAGSARLRGVTQIISGRGPSKSRDSHLLAVLRDPDPRRDDPLVREVERKFRTVWDACRDGLRLIDAKGTILAVNEAYCRMVSKSRDELINQPFSVVYPEARRNQILTTFRQRCEGRAIEPVTVRQDTLWDGKVVWCEITHAFLVSADTAPQILSIFRDTTAQRRDSERIRQLDVILASIEEAVAITESEPRDDKGRAIRYVNHGFVRLTGYGVDEVIGRSLVVLQGPETEREALDQLRSALDREMPARVTLTQYRKDGVTFRAVVTMIPIVDRERNQTQWISLQRPIAGPGGNADHDVQAHV